MARAWLLNLDADDELARPVGYTPSDRTRANVAHFAESIVGLVLNGDVVLTRSDQLARGCEGRAWSPTPSALRALASAGATLPRAPSLEVLRRVADRRFGLAILPRAFEAIVVSSRDEAEQAIASLASTTGDVALKRLFGFAGRGVRRARLPLDATDKAFLDGALRRDGAIVMEPWRSDRRADFALHGFVDARGALTLGEPTIQLIDARAGWTSSRIANATDLDAGGAHALRDAAERAAEALTNAGYFGPFGVDAFACDAGLHASELNPRYTMAWAIGMRDRRPDLDEDRA